MVNFFGVAFLSKGEVFSCLFECSVLCVCISCGVHGLVLLLNLLVYTWCGLAYFKIYKGLLVQHSVKNISCSVAKHGQV